MQHEIILTKNTIIQTSYLQLINNVHFSIFNKLKHTRIKNEKSPTIIMYQQIKVKCTIVLRKMTKYITLKSYKYSHK